MAISEASRHEMRVKLEEVLGAQVANTVMEHLPPVGWADVATKRDLDAVQVLMKRDLDRMQVLVKRDLDALQVLVRHDLDALQVLFEGRLDAQSGLFEARLDAGVSRVAAELAERLRTQTLVLCTTLIAGMGVVAALARS